MTVSPTAKVHTFHDSGGNVMVTNAGGSSSLEHHQEVQDRKKHMDGPPVKEPTVEARRGTRQRRARRNRAEESAAEQGRGERGGTGQREQGREGCSTPTVL